MGKAAERINIQLCETPPEGRDPNNGRGKTPTMKPGGLGMHFESARTQTPPPSSIYKLYRTPLPPMGGSFGTRGFDNFFIFFFTKKLAIFCRELKVGIARFDIWNG